jgi:uncharacterized membrane protein
MQAAAAQRLAGPPAFPMLVGAQQITWNGPYPPPDAVERYERVLPGSFDRILAMAERVSTAQINQSQIALDNAHHDNRRGNWLGFVIGAMAIVAAVICAALNQPWLGAVFLAVPVMGLGKSLVESARQKNEENPPGFAAPQSQGSPVIPTNNIPDSKKTP